MSLLVSDARDGWGSARISPVVALLAALLLILILPPTLFLIATSLHVANPDGSFGAFTLQYYRQLFTSPYLAASLRNTVAYAIGSAVVAIGLGATAALIVERTNAPARRYAFPAAILSLGVPHVLYVVAWLLLLGRAGPVNALIDYVGGAGQGPLAPQQDSLRGIAHRGARQFVDEGTHPAHLL